MSSLSYFDYVTGGVPAPRADDIIDVAKLRQRLLMSQRGFARRYGVPLATLRNWERGSRVPDAAARAYLTVIARDPERVAAVFAGVTPEALLRLSMRELKLALAKADAPDAEGSHGDEAEA